MRPTSSFSAALALAALVSVPLLATGCSSSESAADTTGPAGAGGAGGAGGGAGQAGDAGAGGEAPAKCDTKGVSKGPWVVATDGTSAKVRWQTCVPGAKDVAITPESGGTATTATATETSYELTNAYKSVLTEAPQDLPGTYYLYEAALTGLAPASCFTYAVAGEAARTGRFCTARAPGDPFTFLAMGDTNPALGHTASTVTAVLAHKPDFTLHGGDMQYYSGLETWASWFPMIQPLLASGAFFPAVGNHESEKPDEYEGYFKRFFGGAGFDGQNEYYRFTSGGLWFFSLNTQLDFDAASAQGQWFTAKLADAKKQKGFRGSIVFLHRPFFTCGDSDHHPTEQASLEPAMKDGGVKLVLQAHMHGYERFEINGITYVTTGGGGGAIGDVDASLDRPECASRKVSGKYPHGTILDVKAATLEGTVIDEKGVTRDTFSLPL